MGAIYWFQAKLDPSQMQAGQIEKIVFYHPGDLNTAQTWAREQKYGSPGVRYSVAPIPVAQDYPQPVLLSVQISLGGMSPQPRGVVVSAQHVAGGQPMNEPHGQRQDRPPGERDPRSKFQELSDADLPVGPDGGGYWADDPGHGTFMDFYPNARIEVPRQQ